MNDLNKITNTRIGDNIHYYVNGKEDRGVVVKMNNAYVSVLKGNGSIDEIHINDTFFIKDILTNKTWNGMTLEERTIELNKAHAYSPRFLAKTWEQLPQELKDVLQKTNIEESTHGQLGGNRAGISTATDVKAPEDYKGESSEDKKEEFKHEKEKPTVGKNNGMEEDHKKKDQIDGMKEDWRPTGGESDKQKNFLNKSEPLWKTWLSKTLNRPSGFAEEGARTRKEGVEEGERPTQDNPFPKTKIPKGHKAPTGVGKPKHGGHGYNTGNASRFNTSISDASKRGLKKYGQPHYGVTSLEKEGDGAGNSGVNSLETTGVYNARYSDNKGRYRDQQKDKE